MLLSDVKDRLARGIHDHRKNFPNLNIALQRINRLDGLLQN